MTPELLFGSMPQVWPALAYAQPPVGNRPISPIPPGGVGMPTPALASGVGVVGTPATAAVPAVAFNGGLPAMMAGFAPGPIASFEVPGGLTVPALLATVAVRRGQPLGPTNDQEIEDFIGDALDMLPGSNDIEVRCDGGRVTLSGQVSQKRLKRDAGEIAWVTPGVNDVQNNATIVARRRSRSSREAEAPVVQSRK